MQNGKRPVDCERSHGSSRIDRRAARRRSGPVLAAALGLLGTISAGAQEPPKPSAPPEWQPILTLQLRDEYRCDFDRLVFHREVQAGNRTSTEGRARCLDGREFDFTRDAAHEKFVLRLCMPAVC